MNGNQSPLTDQQSPHLHYYTFKTAPNTNSSQRTEQERKSLQNSAEQQRSSHENQSSGGASHHSQGPQIQRYVDQSDPQWWSYKKPKGANQDTNLVVHMDEDSQPSISILSNEPDPSQSLKQHLLVDPGFIEIPKSNTLDKMSFKKKLKLLNFFKTIKHYKGEQKNLEAYQALLLGLHSSGAAADELVGKYLEEVRRNDSSNQGVMKLMNTLEDYLQVIEKKASFEMASEEGREQYKG